MIEFDNIKKLESAIRSEHKVFSTDFFDTLVKRYLVNPTDLFDILAIRHIERGSLPKYFSTKKFKALRIESERLAREDLDQRSSSFEVTLTEIYQKFSELYQGNFDADEAVKVEEEEELNYIYVNPIVLDFIQKQKKKFESIIVVSDIYLSSTLLKKVLKKNGIDDLFDEVYVSCEFRTGKSQRLFDHVQRLQNVEFSEIFHIGDNFHSDYQTPMSKGVSSFHLPNGLSQTWDQLTKESLLFANKQTTTRDIATLQTVGAIQSARTALAGVIGSENCHSMTGATVFGPIFYGYCKWVIDQTSSLENPLYVGLYREGATVVDIIKTLFPQVNSTKLGISRRVINTINLSAELSVGNLLNVLPERNAIHVEDLKKYILLDNLEVKGQWKEHYFRRDSHLATLFFEELLRDERLVQQWKLKLAEYKDRFIAHFSNNILNKEFSHIVLVDLGWSGSIQKTLVANNLIDSSKVLGFYLALNNGSINHNNDRKAGYLIDCFDFESIDDFSLRNVEIFEQALTPNLGSTIDFNLGEPVFDRDLIPPKQREESTELQAGILSFIRYMTSSNSDIFVDFDVLRSINRCIFNRFNLAPMEAELRLFSSWLHDDNVSNIVEQMVPTYLSIFGENFSVSELLNGDFSHYYWPFALKEKITNQDLLTILRYDENVSNLKNLESFSTKVFDSDGELILSSEQVEVNSLNKFFNKLYTISDACKFCFELSSKKPFILNGVVIYFEEKGQRKVKVIDESSLVVDLNENCISGELFLDFKYDVITGFAFPCTFLSSIMATQLYEEKDKKQLLDVEFHIDSLVTEKINSNLKSIFIKGWCFNQVIDVPLETFLEVLTSDNNLRTIGLVRRHRPDVNDAHNLDSECKVGFEGTALFDAESVTAAHLVLKSGADTITFDIKEHLE